MGREFSEGLCKAAAVDNVSELQLSKKLGGAHAPTAVAACAALLDGRGQLQSCDLSKNALTAEVVPALVAVLQTRTLTSLDLSSNSLGAEGGAAVARGVRAGAALKRLCLERCHVGREAIDELATVLQGGSTLTELDVRYNLERWRAEDAPSAQRLATAVLGSSVMASFGGVPLKRLRANSLTELLLGGHGLGLAEGVALGGVLAHATSLSRLCLPNNMLGDEGALALCGALTRSGSALVELDLNENSVGVEGAKAVASFVATSTTLQRLHLNTNMLCGMWVPTWPPVEKGIYDAEGIRKIAEALKASASLAVCNIRFNLLDEKAANTLRTAVAGKVGFDLKV